MKVRSFLPFAVILFVLFSGVILLGATSKKQPSPKEETLKPIQQESGIMKLTSSAFQNNQTLPSKYTCDGKNINPPLTIAEVPQNSKSLVLVMDDPDAPAGTWVHWTVWNIGPETKEIAENSIPAGAVEGKTSFGSTGYGGPCPPSGTHHYFFKLYALDANLSLTSSVAKEDIEKAMNGHILDKAELIGLYSRK